LTSVDCWYIINLIYSQTEKSDANSNQFHHARLSLHRYKIYRFVMKLIYRS